MKKTLLLLTSFILFTSCIDDNSSEEAFEEYQKIINSELATGKKINKFFIGFEFNDDIQKFRKKLDSLDRLGKIESYTSNKGRDIKYDIKYEFKSIKELNGVKFFISPDLHNDSLQGITIHSLDRILWKTNFNTMETLFDSVFDEYKLKYGEPNYIKNAHNVYWINGNLEINIEITKPRKTMSGKSEPALRIGYVNTINSKRLLDKMYRNVIHVDNGTVDKWYQEQKQKSRKPLEDI